MRENNSFFLIVKTIVTFILMRYVEYFLSSSMTKYIRSEVKRNVNIHTILRVLFHSLLLLFRVVSRLFCVFHDNNFQIFSWDKKNGEKRRETEIWKFCGISLWVLNNIILLPLLQNSFFILLFVNLNDDDIASLQ